MKAALDYVTWDGKLWAIPYRIETHGVIYNKDDFKEAGLDPDKPPKTWDELDRRPPRRMTKNGQYGFAITGGGEVGNTDLPLAALHLDERRRHHLATT